MKATRISLGFVPLVDSASLIIAHELEFAAQEGLELDLRKQPSWSALRDLLALGHLDAAHILSPLPIAMSLGLGGYQAAVDALMVLSVNGNVVGASSEMIAKMRAVGWSSDLSNPRAAAQALKAANDAPLTFGVPFPFSMHRELVEYWLRKTGISLDVRIVPPPMMAEALAAGEIDAFCVGEPWGSRAVDSEAGEIILPGSAIWSFAPEKVLAARRDWIEANPVETAALMRAVYAASQWLGKADNRLIATEILSRSDYLGLPADVIERAMTGHLLTQARSLGQSVEGFLIFHDSAATFPWRSQASWIGARIAERLKLDPAEARRVSRECFRTDLYRKILGPEGVDLPGASDKLEGALAHPTEVASARGEMILGPDRFFDGAVFDPFQK